MKKIFSFVFILSFVLVAFSGTFFTTKLALAQDGVPIITYTLNGESSNVIVNPLTNPVQLNFVSDENIENWVSVRIENQEDPSIYKIFLPKSQCDNTSQCNETWDGDISPSDKTLIDGIYSVIVKIENKTEPIFNLTLTSPYTIQVDTSIPEPELTSTFIIRNSDLELYNGSVTLPEAESDRNVLAVLKTIDESSGAFAISNIQEFSFGSYLKCILPQDGTELCDNWQYAVGNLTPSTSIDTTPLVGGETVGIYFGTSHQLILDTNIITAGGSVNVTAQKYDYENNIWNPLTGVSVGVTLPNPEDQWNPIIVATYPVDNLGVANITISDANTYTLGIAEDFYFPSYTVTVSTSSGGGGGGTQPPIFDAEKALAYLKSVQSGDGSFGDSLLYTDWAGIALGAMDETGSSRDSLLAYFNSNNNLSPLVTDNERHTMALLALGQNPYSFGDVNYIKPIIESFDGTQLGDIHLDNDDIFGLIVLSKVGYTKNDEIIIKDVAFVVSAQNADGSWDNSPDMTSAAIQALKSFDSITDVTESLTKATNYLESKQESDGGWGNISSTSWAMQAEKVLPASWSKNGKTGLDYLGTQQATDGAVLPASETLQNRIWATSYAIPAGLGKPWSEIMQSVSKPETEDRGSSNGSRTSASENNSDTQMPTGPVSCPKGDLFSVKTGQACTVIDEKPQITQAPVLVRNTNDSSAQKKTSVISEIQEPADSLPQTTEIIPNTLTAAAIDALTTQEQTTPSNTVPIALGALSGIFLLYLSFRFFIK
ncbi:MAG: prenyltransferase/squalene oxidase repeat-containing protein [Candidatus Paceibacterota bacterium]|jgi:hypothetical protein